MSDDAIVNGGGDGPGRPASREQGPGTAATLFATTGRVGADLAAVDWAATPLGPPSSWPQSLTSAVGILLTSRFAMWMAWGEQLTFLCNDAYRRDTLGSKYPWALGRPAREVWAEIWADIEPRITHVIGTGEATWDEGLLLYLARSGYTEETYHTFSYSPLRDDGGTVAGMLCVVTEDTLRVIGQRQLTTLMDLGARLTSVRSEADVLAEARRSLAADPRSLPFTVTYLFDEARSSATLACATGLPVGGAAPDDVLDLQAAEAAGWPLAAVAARRTTELDPATLLAGLYADAEPGTLRQALVVPLTSQALDEPSGFLLAGLSPFRRIDDAYRGFVELVAGQMGAALANARAYEAERQRAEALAELDRAKTAFFTNVSHELRTPLTLLLGPAADALADGGQPLPEIQRRRVEIVVRNGERLAKLVNTLLDFSRLESGTTVARFEPTDLGAYTAELASMFESATDAVGLRLTVERPAVGPEVHVDREMWAKVVLNLLSNAVKFTFEGGIDVTVRSAEDRAELCVRDTGIGIEPDEQRRLFERFHRVAGARSRSHEGSGIGLALVAELVAVHGGTVEVDSEPGAGSAFTVRIPLGARHLPHPAAGGAAEPADAAPLARTFVAETARWISDRTAGADRPRERAPEAGAGGHGGAPAGRPAILVADDNADMRSYIHDLLAGDYRVRTVPDGAAALEAARRDPPDLVLTDVMMPGLDGFGLLAALAADPATMTVPVVMLSARAGDGAAAEGLEAGADDYLVKPFTARELRARVRANLELDRARRTQSRLERMQVLLDEAERLAEVGSWEIDLTSGTVTGSAEYYRLLRLDPATSDVSLARVTRLVHPDDVGRLQAAMAATERGEALEIEFRLVTADAGERTVRARGLRSEGPSGTWLRGSLQDITEQRRADDALREAAASRQAAQREHRIAEELQRSLLPEPTFEPEHLTIATYYRAGVAGTQVGGDWYDVIELGAGRTALVLGDVMGRGVLAAAVMGQLRSAVRAYARLDLSPADVLGHLDGIVRDLGDDQIVTCVYAIYDPADSTLTYANAGHLPPLLLMPGTTTARLEGGAGPPLGTGPFDLVDGQVDLRPGTVFALYTDGLVERRDRDLETGIAALADTLSRLDLPVAALPAALVDSLVPADVDDDIAVLVARLQGATPGPTLTTHVPSSPGAVRTARHFVLKALEDWAVPTVVTENVTLASDELITNAVVHGRAPVDVRLRRTPTDIFVEVHDGTRVLPQRRMSTEQSESGRGLEIVGLLADQWGTRPTTGGKAVWCRFALPAPAPTR